MAGLYAVVAFVLVVAIGTWLSRRRGARSHYLDEWTRGEGEHRLLDPAADFYVVTRLGQAKVMTFVRRRRASVLITDRTLIVGMKAALSKRHVITHMIHLAQSSEPELGQLTGGLFSKGYVVLSARRGITVEMDGSKPYVRIVPDSTASATNIDHLRLYCDDPEGLIASLRAVSG